MFAQETAQLLVQAHLNNHVNPQLPYRHAIILTMHGTLLRIVAATVSTSYLEAIKTSASPLRNELLYVGRSKPLDIQVRNDRQWAVQVIIGLIRFQNSGDRCLGAIRKLLVLAEKGGH